MKKNISRQVVIISLVSLFTDIASEMLYPVTPVFLTTVIGSSMAVVGLIEGIAELTASLLKGYFGHLSDKLGRRSIFIVAGYSLSALAKPLPGLLPRISTVLFSRVTDRIGKGMRTSPRDALLAAHSKDNTGAVFGFHRGMDTLGAALGPIAALILLNIYDNNYSLIFIAAFIPSVVAVVFTLFVKDIKTKPRESAKPSLYEFWKSSPPAYKRIFFFFTAFSFINSSDVFLILKANDVADFAQQGIIGYILYNMIYAGASYPIGLLADKAGKKKVFIAGLLIFSAVYAGFAFAKDILLIYGLFILYGVYAASTEGVIKAWISDLVPDHSRGSAIGLVNMFAGFAVMAGSFGTGLLWDAFGADIPFIISAGVSLIIALMLMLKVLSPQSSISNMK